MVWHLLVTNFPDSRYLSPEGAAALMARLGDGTIAGGSVYDAWWEQSPSNTI